MDSAKKLESNIWKYTLLLIANKRIFVAVLGAYYLTIPHVTPQIIGAILLAGNISGFIFEIPSGYVSDKIGHKQALIISRVLMAISTVLLLVSNNIFLLILAAIFMSASNAFHSGTGSAFVHETLRALNREKDYTTVTGKTSSIGFAVPIVLMVFIPFMVSLGYKIPFTIALIIDIIGLWAAFSPIAPPVTPEHVEEISKTNFREVMREGYRLNYFAVALYSGIVTGALLAVGGFRAPYQTILAIPVIWFGVFFGIGRGLASLMLALSGKIRVRLPFIKFYRFLLVIYTLLFMALGVTKNKWIIVGLFLVINSFQWGLSKVDGGYQLDIIRSSKFKATLLSAGAQIDTAVAAIASFGVGFAIERLSYRLGFLYLALVFVMVALPLYAYIARRYKSGAYDFGFGHSAS